MTPDEARARITGRAKISLERENAGATLNQYWIGVFVKRILCEHTELRGEAYHGMHRYECPDCGGRT